MILSPLFVVGIVLIAALAFFIIVITQVLACERLTKVGKLLWALVMLSFPFLGPLMWYLWGKDATLNV
ncbi:PLDc N-terminal domain-containing protein [Corynebacterium belfantii]|uniref:PLDc N-terminal domain-containing protein n=1 Tax=Corynebacterium belfantii TaxID=2014537 RepID=UPI001FD5E1D5|nr:PLDc N-terminal domain-containing protein [Corynebacterium belfantii]